ncbi:hypothetical protein J8L98_10585 [Pseudoalteromonas sp. MMG013]|uniref:hypothetical protein n=1 Tax=Pseudoalteromonas sp. MMG013 TaxID=2822687 RepID=UPI001B3824A1|nr:hypothetical protein [Pseudoalteromonas sp. MMG013]MBQ4862133.1 hypothetical protein [Pseudoalteromonas sp. MMG013]
MKTIDLTVNWIFYGVLFLFCFVIYGASQTFPALANILMITSYLLLSGIILLLYLAVVNRRYVHIDKAGLSYSLGLKTEYIPCDTIENIRVTRIMFIKILEISLSNNRKTQFYSWSISAEELERTRSILNSK